MDVHCSTCREPWDTYHLWEDAIFETGLSEAEAKAWRSLSQNEKLSDRYRDEFRAAGWEFGKSVLNVLRCPACPAGVLADPDTVAIKAALEDLLGDDEDGLAATLEDYGL
jgi:hypothetical protein